MHSTGTRTAAGSCYLVVDVMKQVRGITAGSRQRQGEGKVLVKGGKRAGRGRSELEG